MGHKIQGCLLMFPSTMLQWHRNCSQNLIWLVFPPITLVRNKTQGCLFTSLYTDASVGEKPYSKPHWVTLSLKPRGRWGVKGRRKGSSKSCGTRWMHVTCVDKDDRKETNTLVTRLHVVLYSFSWLPLESLLSYLYRRHEGLNRCTCSLLVVFWSLEYLPALLIRRT